MSLEYEAVCSTDMRRDGLAKGRHAIVEVSYVGLQPRHRAQASDDSAGVRSLGCCYFLNSCLQLFDVRSKSGQLHASSPHTTVTYKRLNDATEAPHYVSGKTSVCSPYIF